MAWLLLHLLITSGVHNRAHDRNLPILTHAQQAAKELAAKLEARAVESEGEEVVDGRSRAARKAAGSVGRGRRTRVPHDV